MMKALRGFWFGCLSLAPALVHAQGGEHTTATGLRELYQMNKRVVIAAAEQVGEEHYGFKATADVRSFGQLIGHIANAQFNFCAAASGATRPNRQNWEQITAKAELVAALKESFTFCDGAYEKLSDASGAEVVKVFGQDRARSYPLIFNVAHNNEHYGNIVTYMRLKGLVPPSSQR